MAVVKSSDQVSRFRNWWAHKGRRGRSDILNAALEAVFGGREEQELLLRRQGLRRTRCAPWSVDVAGHAVALDRDRQEEDTRDPDVTSDAIPIDKMPK